MRIEMRGISKRFGAVQANDAIDLDIGPGEVLALLGENGAGKSTLMKILFGLYTADSGEIRIDGEPQILGSPLAAKAAGIAMVFQQFSLVPAMTVRENLLLATSRTPLFTGCRGDTRVLGRLGEIAPGVNPEHPVASLSVGQMQQVELTKAINERPGLLILDEPSAVLTPEQTAHLWALVRRLVREGMSAVLITHKLQDVAACADRVVVLRQGRIAGQSGAGVGSAALTRLMMGTQVAPPRREAAALAQASPRLLVRGLSLTREDGARLQAIDLKIGAGEVLGIAGVSGNGQRLLADALAGMIPVDLGDALLDGQVLASPRKAPGQPSRVGYIPEEPARNAVCAGLPAWLNLHLKNLRELPWHPDRRTLARAARARLVDFDVRPPDPNLPSGRLSGGNLQKLVALREFAGDPALVIACYPGMGLDLAAAARVHEAMFALARQGSAVLWISEELDDLLEYADRLAVMFDGRIVADLPAREADRQRVGAWMAGEAQAEAFPAPALDVEGAHS